MKIETAERAAPGRVSEDRILVRPNAVVVLDGVTSRTRPPDRNGGWYAAVLAAELDQLLDRDDPLPDLLAEAIVRIVDRHDLVLGDSPASTVAITRWTVDSVEALVLADSPVVAFGERTRVLQDNRLAELRPRVANVVEWKNREGGYWVAEADPSAAHQALTATWPRQEITEVIMATDGVSCGIDEYGLFEWDALLEKSPESVLDEIRIAELSDAEHKKWPRFKTHDDQALVVIRDC